MQNQNISGDRGQSRQPNINQLKFSDFRRGNHGRDRMVVRFTTTYVISAYHNKSCEFESYSWRGVLEITLCGKVC
jgi:hypothetical protein